MTFPSLSSVMFDKFCKVLAVIYGTIWVILTPVFFILLSPFYLYRYTICKLAKCFRPDFAKMLTMPNAAIASCDKFTGETQNTTVIAIKIKGTPDLEEARKLVTERLIEAKLSDNSKELRNPELKQYPVKWLGYYFWKPDLTFDIKDHVYFYTKTKENETSLDGSATVYSEEDAATVEAELVAKPHKKGKSPWEFVILNPVMCEEDGKENEEYSFIFYRNHHLLTDGFGILNLMMDLCGVDLLRKPPPVQNVSRLQKLFYYTTQVIRSPYDVFLVPLQSTVKMENKFRLPNKDLGKKHVGSKPICIPLEKLKEIRKKNSVSVTAIQYSLWAGALRRTMEKKNLKVPDYIQCSAPQTLPFSHPEKLRIFAGFWLILLPTGIDNAVLRLKAIEKRIKNLRRSSAILGSYYFLKPYLGPLPPVLLKAFYPMLTGTACLNCFPGPPEHCIIFNRDVTQVHFSFGQTMAHFSALFSSISYCGNVYMKTTINDKIYDNPTDVEQFQNCMLEELAALSKETV